MLGFIHIPKTSGTSINHALKQKFDSHYNELSPTEYLFFLNFMKDYYCVSGHIPACFFELDRSERRCFTIIREPISRGVSFLNHIQNEDAHYANKYILNKNFELKDVFTISPLKDELSNLQTKMLGASLPSHIADLFDKGDSRAIREADLHYNSQPVTDHMLENAQKRITSNIEALVFGQIQRSANDSLLNELYDKDFIFPRLRSSPMNHYYSDEILDLLKENNKLDMMLYEFSMQIYLQKVARGIMARSELLDLEGAPYKFKGMHKIEKYKDGHLRWTNGYSSLWFSLKTNWKHFKIEVEVWNLGIEYNIYSTFMLLDRNVLRFSKSNSSYTTFEISIDNTTGNTIGGLNLEIISDTRRFCGDPRDCGVPLKSIRISE